MNYLKFEFDSYILRDKINSTLLHDIAVADLHVLTPVVACIELLQRLQNCAVPRTSLKVPSV